MGNEQRTFVINHIKRFPRYTSHYSRKANSQTKYLSSDSNIKIVYDLYKTTCKDEKKIPVKLSYYRYIFNSEFNLRFHRPHSVTCFRCDSHQNIIKYPNDDSKVSHSKVQVALHQKRFENAINMKKSDIEKYRLSTNTVVVCFDLQQSLPTPLLTTSKNKPMKMKNKISIWMKV
ncbi:unnamed protein product [Acanthoscelides obtectus]|uniref:Uncharacterized protein n=1 Tax=Acanthoscelides obtectus TaxID=200917 RepID=A0A9P0LCR6_ACAOB|nr:unnamed protein product [Acanthoscelides obtectus]CAK1650100.1 hypothetical protein AOBTE_LOCUS16600 [Acanthoscelides obtectus]